MESVHIHYDQELQPYHEVVADLVCSYIKQEGTVLDIGCGVGHTLWKIREKRPDLLLWAADIDEHCLQITEERVGLQRRLHLHAIEDLYHMQMAVDAVIMSHSLEHMRRPVDTVREIMKFLITDGVLVLAVPNPVRLQVVLSSICKQHYVNRGHVCAWDRSHWMNFLENILGLQVICYAEDYFPLPLRERLPFIRRFEKSLVRIFPWLSFSNIAVVKKRPSDQQMGLR